MTQQKTRQSTRIVPGFLVRDRLVKWGVYHHELGQRAWAHLTAALADGAAVWIEYLPGCAYEVREGDAVVYRSGDGMGFQGMW